MTFKEYEIWCNARACDGYWSYDTARFCIGVLQFIKSLPFWKRKEAWRKCASLMIRGVINPINQKICATNKRRERKEHALTELHYEG